MCHHHKANYHQLSPSSAGGGGGGGGGLIGMHRVPDYGTVTTTPSSTSSTGNPAKRVNIIRNRFFSYGDDHGDAADDYGLPGQPHRHSEGCETRWIRMRDGRGGEGCRCGETPQDDGDEPMEGDGAEDEEERRHLKGGQRWRNVKAVMAYYYALRKIKRNVAFVFKHRSHRWRLLLYIFSNVVNHLRYFFSRPLYLAF